MARAPGSDPFPMNLPDLALLVDALARMKAGDTMEQAAGAIAPPQQSAPSAKTIQRLLNAVARRTGERLHDPAQRCLTPAGEEFLDSARVVVETYRARLFPQAAHPFFVGVACYPSLARSFLPRVMALLGLSDAKRPEGAEPMPEGASIRLTTGNRGAFFDDLRAGAIHLCVATAGLPGKLQGEIVEEELFRSRPLGIIHHRDNPNKALWRKPFRFESLATECVLWLGTDRREALEQPLAHLLPVPAVSDPGPGQASRHGRRIVMPTYQSILEAVKAGVGVGFGHRPHGTEQGDLRFIGFAEVEVPEDRPSQRWREKLLAQEQTRFSLFRRTGWHRPAEEGGLPPAARLVADAVRRAADGYEHRYA